MEQQSATLRKAMDALNSICRTTPGESERKAQRDVAVPLHLDASRSDPEEWRAPFVQWVDSACALHPRCFGGIACLHLAFCEWEIARDEVPCNRQIFEQLLTELGFLMGEVGGAVLVSGLILREDLNQTA